MSALPPDEQERIAAHARKLANRTVLQKLYALLGEYEDEERAKRRLLPRVIAGLALAVSLLIILILVY
ncbi:MAG: hypothetical protein IPK29_00015 [Betaproteobacteria bacterium]|jgi:hypothetical protein|nr:hypothetical protein [Betaproteobacteria bacterium]